MKFGAPRYLRFPQVFLGLDTVVAPCFLETSDVAVSFRTSVITAVVCVCPSMPLTPGTLLAHLHLRPAFPGLVLLTVFLVSLSALLVLLTGFSVLLTASPGLLSASPGLLSACPVSLISWVSEPSRLVISHSARHIWHMKLRCSLFAVEPALPGQACTRSSFK